METDPLVLSVLQPYGVVSHTQQCDDEVDQSEDAVEPQKAVPARHKNMPVTYTSNPIQCFSTFLRYFNTFDVIHKVSDLLCTNVSQCRPSKVLRTVSCRNNATWHVARHFQVQRPPTPPFVWRVKQQWSNAAILRNRFPDSLMKCLLCRWNFTLNSQIAVTPNSAHLIWAPFVCCCHSGLPTGIALFDGWGWHRGPGDDSQQ